MLLGVGDLMSVKVPYAMPDRSNPLAFNPGQGCATLLAGFGALADRGILLVPTGVFVVGWSAPQPLAVATVAIVSSPTLRRRDLAARPAAARGIATWWRLPELAPTAVLDRRCSTGRTTAG